VREGGREGGRVEWMVVGRREGRREGEREGGLTLVRSRERDWKLRFLAPPPVKWLNERN